LSRAVPCPCTVSEFPVSGDPAASKANAKRADRWVPSILLKAYLAIAVS
jgi:hypothetical protein